MNSTTISITWPLPVLTVVRGDGAAGVSQARRAARAFTDRLTPAPRPDMAETLALVISELVTNSLRHGGGHYTLGLTAGPHALTAAVSDPSPAHPREHTPDLGGSSGGFGWHMIRRLTHHLTITPSPGYGKTIHAQLPR
ncbi:ATP-binding protein [Streptomyces sp. NPDC005548]|uniref:ATP-binding protein n=1 Tax=Streptomyces sp. NPDC005548 TaxID=3364724 RepID=UPI0036917A8B